MGSSESGGGGLTREEIAWEFVELFDELPVDRVNELLAKNVPLETLQFISAYASDFADVHELAEHTRKALPNLMVFGYIVRVLEERMLDDDSAS